MNVVLIGHALLALARRLRREWNLNPKCNAGRGQKKALLPKLECRKYVCKYML
jgi:hypothetical protein